MNQDKISLRDFTVDAVVDGAFAEQMPEFYQLRDVVESQGWHDDQTVFDHSIDSVRALEQITRFDYLDDGAKQKLQGFLRQTVERSTRLDLLRLATFLHDIGKTVSLQKNASGNTNSPSHGLIGTWVAVPVLERFDLTPREHEFVLSLIGDHLVPSDLIEMSINNATDYHQVTDLLTTHLPDTRIELLLLAYADWMGCDIRESVRQERDQRVVIAHQILSDMAATL